VGTITRGNKGLGSSTTTTIVTNGWCTRGAALGRTCSGDITTDNDHSRTKHLDQQYHFIHDVASKGTIKLVYCPTDDMVADVLTKALPKWKVAAHTNTLGMCCACGGVME
jgi:hypothetical protein